MESHKLHVKFLNWTIIKANSLLDYQKAMHVSMSHLKFVIIADLMKFKYKFNIKSSTWSYKTSGDKVEIWHEQMHVNMIF